MHKEEEFSNMKNNAQHNIFVINLLVIIGMMLVSFSAPLKADDQVARDLLSQAMHQSLAMSYSCDVADNELLTAAGAARGTFWRLVLPDGFVCRKIALFDTEGKTVVIYTSNRKGNFAFADNEWAKVADIMPLWYFDYLSSDFDDFEKSICTYSKRIINVDGNNIQEIRLDTTTDINKLKKSGNKELPFWGEDGADDLYSPFYAKRPMRRIFLVDLENNFILSRTHYNVRNQKIFERKITNLDLSPNIAEKDFEPSGRIAQDYIWLHEQFMNKHFGKVYQSKQKTLPDSTYYEPSILERLDNWLFDDGGANVIVWSLRIGGVICLAVIGIVYWRRRKQ